MPTQRAFSRPGPLLVMISGVGAAMLLLTRQPPRAPTPRRAPETRAAKDPNPRQPALPAAGRPVPWADILPADGKTGGNGVRVTAWSWRPRYRVGEPLQIGFRVRNATRRSLVIDRNLIFAYHVDVFVADAAGHLVFPPPGMPRARRVASRSAFIRLRPGRSLRDADVAHDYIVLRSKGKYQVLVRYSDGASGLQGRELYHLPAWSGCVTAPALQVVIE
jgi:hypothetical protein